MCLAQRTVMRTYSINEVIFSINDPAKEMFIIEKGIIFSRGWILSRHKTFGEEMLFRSITRTYSARTITNSVLYVLSGSDVEDVLNSFPELKASIRQRVAR